MAVRLRSWLEVGNCDFLPPARVTVLIPSCSWQTHSRMRRWIAKNNIPMSRNSFQVEDRCNLSIVSDTILCCIHRFGHNFVESNKRPERVADRRRLSFEGNFVQKLERWKLGLAENLKISILFFWRLKEFHCLVFSRQIHPSGGYLKFRPFIPFSDQKNYSFFSQGGTLPLRSKREKKIDVKSSNLCSLQKIFFVGIDFVRAFSFRGDGKGSINPLLHDGRYKPSNQPTCFVGTKGIVLPQFLLVQMRASETFETEFLNFFCRTRRGV